ncbi:MAG: biopolymer transporter ExbD, partial [bacterium]|nr:biopolymer transporter ExbD [bacterium]
MGGMVGGESKSHARGKKKQWKKPRIMVRVDMTPMVDVAFLLLIFFMVTTVFRLPQAMEINLPPEQAENTEIEIKQSTMLNFRVDNDNKLYANVGNDLPKLIPWDSLESKILERRTQVGTKLTIVAKLLPQAPFS